MPTVNNQQPKIACSIETKTVDLKFLYVKANRIPPIKVKNRTNVFLNTI